MANVVLNVSMYMSNLYECIELRIQLQRAASEAMCICCKECLTDEASE